jgi:hypothetical protein
MLLLHKEAIRKLSLSYIQNDSLSTLLELPSQRNHHKEKPAPIPTWLLLFLIFPENVYSEHREDYGQNPKEKTDL